MRKPILIPLAIILIFIYSIFTNAQTNETNQETRESKSWFSNFVQFFESFFKDIFQIYDNKIKSVSKEQELINKSKNLIETKTTEAPKEQVQNVLNITKETVEKIEEKPIIQTKNILNTSGLTCGYCQYLIDNICLNYSCCKNEECKVNEYCSEHQCKSLKCADCRYIINHTCQVYECCKAEDCKVEHKCEENKCVKDNCFIKENKILNENKSIPFEILDNNTGWGGSFYSKLIFKPQNDLGYAIVKNKGEWEELKNAAAINSQFSDFDNFFLIIVYLEDSCGPVYPEIDSITQNKNTIIVHFTRKGSCKDVGDSGGYIVKVNRSYLVPREYLYFYFFEGSQLSQSKSEAIHLNIAPPKGYYLSCPYYKICREEPCCDYYYCRISGTDYNCNRIFSCNGVSGL